MAGYTEEKDMVLQYLFDVIVGRCAYFTLLGSVFIFCEVADGADPIGAVPSELGCVSFLSQRSVTAPHDGADLSRGRTRWVQAGATLGSGARGPEPDKASRW